MSNNALQTIINARLPGKEGLWQIHLLDGKISAIDAQSGVMPVTENSLDAEQGLVIPPFVEPHIHLDTTQTAGQPNWNQSGTLFEGIERWAERKALLTHDDVKQRAWQTLKWQIANGIQHVRTHVDVSDATLTALKAMLEVKQEVAPWIDLQIVAFPQEGILSYPNGEALLEEALRLGADVVGAIPHFEFTREYGVESLHKTFALAQKYDRLIDVHCDEIDDAWASSRGIADACYGSPSGSAQTFDAGAGVTTGGVLRLYLAAAAIAGIVGNGVWVRSGRRISALFAAGARSLCATRYCWQTGGVYAGDRFYHRRACPVVFWCAA